MSCGFTVNSRGVHSVIDYFLLKENDLNALIMFEIRAFKYVSDHAALRFGMRAIKPLTEDTFYHYESRAN
jgi:hypothetical protein